MSSSGIGKPSDDAPLRAQVRRLLEAVLPSAADFDAFASDYFHEQYRRLSAASDLKDRHTLLLALVEPEQILAALRQAYPGRVEKLEKATESEDADLQKRERELAEKLAQLLRVRDEIRRWTSGADTTRIDAEIHAAEKALRHGPSLRVGEVLAGRYQLSLPLGTGTFAEVFQAKVLDGADGEAVAIKVLHGQWSKDRTLVKRFASGARQQQGLQHPNIVRVLSPASEYQGFHYFVMEYLPGGDLYEAVLKDSAGLRREQWIRAVLDIGQALSFAHERVRTLVHRDVKPHNILLTADGIAKLCDFDLVVDERALRMTRTLQGLGTPDFAAPEQQRNAAHVDQRADVYGLARTLMFVLLGRSMFDQDEGPTQLLQRLPASRQLRQVLQRATQRDPSARPSSVAAFCAELEQALPAPQAESPAPPAARTDQPKAHAHAKAKPESAEAQHAAAPLPAQPPAAGPDAAKPAPNPAAGIDSRGRALRVGPDIFSAAPAAVVSSEPRKPPPSPEPAAQPAPSGPAARLLLLWLGAIPVLVAGMLWGLWSVLKSPPIPMSLAPDLSSARSASSVADLRPPERPPDRSAPSPPDLGTVRDLSVSAPKPASPPSPAPPPPAPKIPGMVWLPGGKFVMGSKTGESNEKPEHEVEVAGFYMDRTEVTAEAYALCVVAGGCAGQNTVEDSTYNDADKKRWNPVCNLGKAGRGNHPMNCVSWDQAKAYCAWAGKRLPSETEWEYAARGTAGRKYPWGNAAPGPGRLNACGSECVEYWKKQGVSLAGMYTGSDGYEATAPVGSIPGDRTPEGILDLGGNVLEWMSNFYTGCYGMSCPTTSERATRGASWAFNYATDGRAADRSRYAPATRISFLGFRCAKTK